MNGGTNSQQGRPLRALIGWPKTEPPYPTPLIERCEAALDVPLERQTVETLRLLVGQDIGTSVLLPIALNVLEHNILASGDLYEGDLLAACLRLPTSYWNDHPKHWTRLDGILENFRPYRQTSEQGSRRVSSEQSVWCSAMK